MASTFLSLDDDAAFSFAAALAEGVFFADGLSADTSRKKCLELRERL